MKLIDILVRDLGKFGGWPEGAVECVRYIDEATIDFYDEHGNWPDDCSLTYGAIAKEICVSPNEPCQREIVIYSEYEAALAASKTEWDGEGFPTAGTRCEFISNGTSWGEVDVIGIDGDKVVFKPSGETYYGIAPSQRQIFRPIRSEADKKKYATIEEMLSTFFGAPPVDEPNENDRVAMAELYDAIKSGKIIID